MLIRLSALVVTFLCTAAVVDADERPNILLAIADDWSFGHASAYGCGWVDTPSFDRVAKEGILFRRAYTPNAKCAPSRATILTGRYSWQLEEAGNHMCIFPVKFGGYVERLAADGYFAGFTGKGWGPGIANDSSGTRRAIRLAIMFWLEKSGMILGAPRPVGIRFAAFARGTGFICKTLKRTAGPRAIPRPVT